MAPPCFYGTFARGVCIVEEKFAQLSPQMTWLYAGACRKSGKDIGLRNQDEPIIPRPHHSVNALLPPANVMKHVNLFGFFFTLVSFILNGQTVIPDPGFGSGGIVMTDLGGSYERIYSIAVQSDGKIVTGGYSCDDLSCPATVMRHNPDGTPDSSFNNVGYVKTSLPNTDFLFGGQIALQSDGKILMLCNNDDFKTFVIRYHPDGTPDNSFGTDGIKELPNIYHSANIAVQPDMKIIVSYSINPGFALVRLYPDGAIDSTFGNTGLARAVIPNIKYASVVEMVVQTDGKIVLGGYIHLPPPVANADWDYAMTRFQPDGSVDSAFGTAGIVKYVSPDISDKLTDLALQSDGKLVVAAESGIYRFYPDGTMDAEFAEGNGAPYFHGRIAVQPDDKIVICNKTAYPDIHFQLWRLNPAGILDTGFANMGHIETDLNSNPQDWEWPYDIALQNDHKILVAGEAENGLTNNDFALIRYLNDLVVSAGDFSTEPITPLVYPNPVGDEVVLKWTELQSPLLSVCLYDAGGNLIHHFPIPQDGRRSTVAEQRLVFPSSIAPGYYFLNVRTERGNAAVKIVKL